MRGVIFFLFGFFILLNTQVVFSQDIHLAHHDRFDEVFSSLPLSKVVEEVNAEDRYYSENIVQEYVDEQYMLFQGQINALIENNSTVSEEETDQLVNDFLFNLNANIRLIPLGKKQDPGVPKVLNGPCVNMDFEAGNTTGWTLQTGTRTNATLYNFSAPVPVGPGANHQIFGGGIDPVVGISRVAPGGAFSCRLGNGTTTGSGAARMSQAFLVDASNMYFTYQYAVIFQSPNGHAANERPYFTVRVYDQFGVAIPCGDYSVYADAANAASYNSITFAGNTILYTNWQSVFTNLSAYVGQNVTVEFTTGDCSLGGHYGYAYIDASCSFQQITNSQPFLCPGQTTLLTAPPGVGTYLWNTGATTSSITTGTAGTYTCTLTPPQGPACAVTLNTLVTVYPQPVASFTAGNACVNSAIPFTSTTTIPAPGAIASYQWNFGDGTSTPASSGGIVGVLNTTGTYTNPSHTYTVAGTYNVTLTVVSTNGCTSSITTPITVYSPPTLSRTFVNVLCNGGNTGSINLTVAGGNAPYSYAWSNGAITEDITGLAAGTYTVVVTTATGCTATISATITQPAAPLTLSTTQTNILCNGGNTGAINLTPAGGTAPYTYSWSNGSVAQDLSGLTAGTYTVVVNDANGSTGGCTATTTVTITQPAAAITLSTTQTNVICNGAATGNIDLTPLGGTAPYSYSWSNGAITQDLSGLSAGSYTVVVNDANGSAGGCTATTSVTITQPAAPVSITSTKVNVLCNGGATGSIDITPAGGTPAYNYTWSNGAVTQDISGLTAGTYTVTVNDAAGVTSGCTATASITITQPAAALSTSFTQVNVLCNGGATGSINLSVAGGTAPYTYAWSNGAITQDISALTAGTYTVVVNDANGSAGGCTASATVTITQPAAALTLSATQTNILCNGGNTGAIDLTPAGGTAPYSYSWSNGAVTQDLNTLTAGTYTVVVNDANGSAGGCTASATVTITQPAAALTLSSTQTNILCNGGNTGAIDLTPAGGTAPYSYSWSNGAITQDLSGLTAGTYTVIVNDANGSTGGCTATASITITQPAAALSTSFTQVNVLCNGGATGSINLSVAGGTAPYTYAWSNGAVTQDISALTAGTYTVVVNDANGSAGGCTASATVTITQPAAALTLSSTQTNILCNGGNTGAIDLTPAGGTAPYSYSWSNGAVTQDLNTLTAGTYTVVVNDANGSAGGCTATTSITITQPAAALTLSSTQTNILCNGGNTGAIDLTPAGGTAPYSYSWSNGAITQDLSGLTAGTYTVIVNDANGSTGGCTATASITITQPAAALSTSFTQVNVLCNGGATGSINLSVAGGTAPYTYAWSNGAVTQDISALTAGTYTVVVNDANGSAGGCTASATVTITQPAAALTLSSTQTNILCNGGNTGAIDLTPAGGTAPYSYSWSNGAITQDLNTLTAGTYTVVVNDANGSAGGCTATTSITITQPAAALTLSSTQTNILCNGGNTGAIDLTPAGGTAPYSYSWSNGAITQDLSGLTAGTYTVIVNDANGSTGGCTATASITITQPAAALSTSFTQVNVLCNGGATGSINLSVAGGTAPYAYAWSNGAVTQDISALTAGTYTVVVNDANGSAGGCTASATVTITQPLAPLTLSSTQVNVLCNGASTGSIDLTPTGGTAPYSYTWSNGAVTQDLTNISIGTYTVVVNDANGSTGGCTATASITITEPAALTTNLVPSVYAGGFNVSGCVADGTIDLTPGGGNPGYTYVWNTGAVTEDVNGLLAGLYTVTVTDLNGCSTVGTITLTQPSSLTQNVTATTFPSGTNISCFGLSNGNINLTIGGGVPGYTYLWNTGAITEDLTNVPAGAYSVVITDLAGCQINSSITLTQPAILTQSISSFTYPSGSNISCFGLNDGSVDLTIAGGNPGYSYAWSNGAITQDLAGLTAGTYNVTVTDVNGCSIPSTITLVEPTVLTQNISALTYPSGTNISCFGLSDGSVDLTIGGGNPGYTYAWSNGAVTQDLAGVPAGTYNVTVTDINGCSIPSSITLTQPAILTQGITSFTYPSGSNISCFGLSNGSIDLTIAGGNPGYNYVWSSGALTQDIAGLPAGTYNVTVTDINGCSIPSTITLTQPTALTQGISATVYPSGTNISCFGLSDGAIDLSIGGGSPGYTYAWSNGAITQDLAGLPVGTYNVTVTDLNGCTIPSTITLTEPTLLTTNLVPSVYSGGFNLSGCLPDGTINQTVAGGNPGYTYVWSNGSNNEDLTALAAGLYNVTVTDINGCSVSSSITLTQPAPLTQGITSFTYPSGTNISCNGLSDGSINLTINGGVPGYTYLWNTGAITEDLGGLAAGTYSVIVTDQNNCQIASTITLTQPTILTQAVSAFTYPSGTNISCFGLSDGSINLTPGGGSPGYTYVWNNGAITQNINGLSAGTYSVVITDINGCTIPSTITLSQPTALTEAVSAFTYPSGTNISCFGLSDGSVDLTIGGGSPGYTYIWSNGAVTEDLSGLPIGTYNVTVTDINGCTIPTSITLTQPTVLTQGVTAFTYPSGTNISCFGLSDGSVDLTIVGGNPGYTYSWSNGAVTQDLTGLPIGTYNVIVTDINGCSIPSSITLSGPTQLTQGITAGTYPSGTNISCFGLSDGSIDLTIGGGNPGYSYLWNTGAITQDLAGLPIGNYTVLVTDINGCTIPSAITLNQPTVLTEGITAATYASGTNISCFGLSDGSIDLTIGGGSPGYTYTWSNGSVTEDLVGIPAGTYNVTVTDINGCTIPSTITLTEPTDLIVSEVVSLYAGGFNVSGCIPDGFIDASPVGGNPGYTYLWSNGAVTQDLANLFAGTYSVTITDVNGCQASFTEVLTQPANMTSTTAVTSNYNGEDISCVGASDGSVDVISIGGVPPYTFSWEDALGNVVSNVQSPTGLPAGVYTVDITDQNGCMGSNSIVLTDPTPLAFGVNVISNYNGQQISCFGASDGALNLNVNGGTPGYTYVWTNSLGAVVSNIQDPFSLPADQYDVLVTDINGCSFTTSISLANPPAMGGLTSVTSNYNGAEISCFGALDGAVTVNPTGGVPGYNYAWVDAGGNVLGNNQNQAGVPAGAYTVQVTDLNGCIYVTNVNVSQPAVLTLNANIISDYFGQAVSCIGAMDGSVQGDALGGTPAYQYSWNGGPFSGVNVNNNLGVGPITINVVDANGCTATSSVILDANPTPSMDLPPVIYSCEGYEVAINSNSEPGSSCTWVFSDGQVINDCGPVYISFPEQEACYDVQLTVITPQGCISQTQATDFICVVPNPVASFSPIDYEISLTNPGTNFINNSENAVNYFWNFGDNSPWSQEVSPYHEFPLDENTSQYEVWLYAISLYGCIDSTMRIITVTEDMIIYVPNTFTPDGDEFNNEFIPVISSGFSEDGYSLLIFNRWGQLIFESHDQAVGWDGTYNGERSQDGTYTWKIILKNIENDNKEEYVGHVNLLR